MNRIIKVGRMQLINRWNFIGVPLTIMGACLVLVIILGLLIPGNEPFYTGAGQAPLWYFFGSGIQALTLTFPFSQGLSIARRTYFIGTALTFLLLALAISVLYYVLSLTEQATDGWGVGGHIYNLPWIADGPWYQTILFFWMVTMLMFFLGFWAATIYKRWATTGLLVGGLCLAAIGVAAVGLLTWTSSWRRLWDLITSLTTASASGLIVIVVLALAGGSFITLRRALP